MNIFKMMEDVRVGDWCFSFTRWTERLRTLEVTAGLDWKACGPATLSLDTASGMTDGKMSSF